MGGTGLVGDSYALDGVFYRSNGMCSGNVGNRLPGGWLVRVVAFERR